MLARCLLSFVLAIAVVVASGGVSIAAKDKQDRTEKSPVVSVEQLNKALAPISGQLEALQLENEHIRARLSRMPAEQTQDNTLGETVQTLRIAVVVMGLGLLGGLWKLRNLARQLKN